MPNSQEPDVELSNEQLDVLEMVQDGESVFFTGSAGTGKSVLLRKIIRICRRRYAQQGYGDVSLAVTASTGLAAVNIGGGTLHSWAGIGLGKEPLGVLMQNFVGFAEWKRRKEEAWENLDKREMYLKAGIVFDPEDRGEVIKPAPDVQSTESPMVSSEESDEAQDLKEGETIHVQDSTEVQKGETIRIQGHPGLVKRWNGVRTLIIDESGYLNRLGLVQPH